LILKNTFTVHDGYYYLIDVEILEQEEATDTTNFAKDSNHACNSLTNLQTKNSSTDIISTPLLSKNQNFEHTNIIKKQVNSSNKNIRIVTVSSQLLSKSRNLENKNIIQKKVNSSNNHIRIDAISTPFYKNKNPKCNNTKMKRQTSEIWMLL